MKKKSPYTSPIFFLSFHQGQGVWDLKMQAAQKIPQIRLTFFPPFFFLDGCLSFLYKALGFINAKKNISLR